MAHAIVNQNEELLVSEAEYKKYVQLTKKEKYDYIKHYDDYEKDLEEKTWSYIQKRVYFTSAQYRDILTYTNLYNGRLKRSMRKEKQNGQNLF